ncbi:MAG: type I-E CRISPR-associated protein Cse1/CasA [Gemmatimonadota bacterium]
MSQFNLLDEPWIPVRFVDGQRKELGIRDVFLRSKDVSAIEDPSPLVVAALHRLLLAILYRALEGPTEIAQAKALFRDGIPAPRIEEYLGKWSARFWLFDEKYPFYQVAGYVPREKKGQREWKAWPVLAAEHNADNAKVLFDHVEIAAAGSIPSRVAAKWLIACQTFALGGGNSDFGYTKGAPSATSVMALPLGIHLHDTLLIALVPENREVLAKDRPIWEQEPISIASLESGRARPPLGIADLYTWLTRSIKLNPEGVGANVSELAFASGVACISEGVIDPMLSYRIDEAKGKLPLRFGERGLWRQFDSLLPDASDLAPRVISHAAALTRESSERAARSVMVLGQANDKAKIEYWRMERFALPGGLGGDRNIRQEIRTLLADAEDAQHSLWAACRSFARDLLGRGERDPAPKDVISFMEQMSVNRSYWSILESRFHEVLRNYTVHRDSEDIQWDWLKSVRDAISTAWEQHRVSVATGDAWSIRALVKAEGFVVRELRDLNARIEKLAPARESR